MRSGSPVRGRTQEEFAVAADKRSGGVWKGKGYACTAPCFTNLIWVSRQIAGPPRAWIANGIRGSDLPSVGLLWKAACRKNGLPRSCKRNILRPPF